MHGVYAALAAGYNFFGIKYTDYEVDLVAVKSAVKKELQGPGKLLRYRAMQQKVREVHWTFHAIWYMRWSGKLTRKDLKPEVE